MYMYQKICALIRHTGQILLGWYCENTAYILLFGIVKAIKDEKLYF